MKLESFLERVKEESVGVSEKMVEKLLEAGYSTTEEVATANKYSLAKQVGITQRGAATVISRIKALYRPTMKTAFEIHQIREKLGHISTGSKDLDALLGGGVELQAMTEFSGQFGSGKSQTMFTLSVLTQLPKAKGGANGSVLFIDTEATFRPKRVLEIAVNRGIDKKETLKNPKKSKVLNNIFVIKAPTTELLRMTVDSLDDMIKEFNTEHKNTPIKLLVVDSLMAPFRSDYIGRGQLADRQQALGKVLQQLQRVAMKEDLAVVFTNQVVSTPDAFFSRDKPAGGHRMGHAAQYRLFLRKGKRGTRIFKVIDAPNIDEEEVVVNLTEKGIE